MKRELLMLSVVLSGCGAVKPQQRHSAATTTATAAPADPDAAPLPLWHEITKGVLPNGLTYYILKHQKPEKRVALWLAVNAGSVQEDDDQRGLAHFDEHMAFNGTKHFPKSAIVDYLEKIGMRFGADVNAYTTFDQTVYQLEVPTDKPEFVGKGLDILRDWAGNVSYEPTEVDKERGVVKEEWRLGRGVARRIHDKQFPVLYAGTRYADRDTIGLPEVIEHAPPERLTRFYKDWYRPDLMAVIAVGDIDPKTIEQEIAARFTDLPAAKSPRARPSGGVPKGTGTRVTVETDKEAQATSVIVSNLVPHRPEANKHDLRRHIVEGLYTAVLNERLQSIARKPGAPFVFALGGTNAQVRDVDSFDRIAIVKGDDVEAALRALFTEVVRIEQHGVSAGELDRARKNMARVFEQMAETEKTQDARQFVEEIARNFFANEFIVGVAAEKAMTLEILPKITTEELNTQLHTFGGADNRVVLIAGPEGKKLPTKAGVLAIIDQVGKSAVPSWEDKTAALALMPTLPKPGKVVAEKKVESVGVTEWTLSNGAHVIVKPTDYELDSVTLEGSSPGGTATASDKDYMNAQFATTAVSVGGLGELDVDALNKVLTAKNAHATVAIHEDTESVSGGGSAHDLETMLQLVHLRMTAPRKDPAAFGVWQQNFAQQLTDMLRSPEAQVAIESSAILWKGNLRKKFPTAAQVQQVDLDKALAFYKARFGNASDFTFVIVGAVQLDTLKPLVETYLASLPSTGVHEKEKDLGIRRVSGVVKKQWNVGREPKARVSMLFHRAEAWTRDKERDLAILGMVLSIKLREVMREDLGGVYGIGEHDDFSRSPFQEHDFSLSFGCDPKRVDELVKAAFDVVAQLAHDGATPEVLEKIHSTYVRQRETDLRKNHFWSSWLSNAYRYGDDPAIVLDVEQLPKRMTSANVKASAKHYIDAKQYFETVMLPAADAAPAQPN